MSLSSSSSNPLAMLSEHSQLSKDGNPLRPVDLLLQAFKDMIHKEIAANPCGCKDGKIAVLQQRLSLPSKLEVDLLPTQQTKAQQITDEHRDLIFEAQKLKEDLEASKEQCKELHQTLKHWETEHRLAINRARTAEEELKKKTSSAEEARQQAEQERKKAQKLQAKVDELLKLQQRKIAQTGGDSGKKPTKDATNSDLVGLQRKNDKFAAQLKKKQDEYQMKSLALQAATKEINELKNEMAKIAAENSTLNSEIDQLKHIQREVNAENTSQFAHAQYEVAKRTRQLEILGGRFVSLKEKLEETRAALISEQKKNEQLSERIAQLTAYEPLGDAEIADRIRIRNLVDQAQERLAIAAGLSAAPGESLALTWRLALGPGIDDTVRVERAKELLSKAKISPEDIAFISNEEALLHACQSYSRFRAPGNDLHNLLERTGYLTSLDRYLKHVRSEFAQASLEAMVDYVCPLAPGSSE